MVRRLNLPVKSKLLDLGCGPGHLAYELARDGFDVYAIDGSHEMIEIAKHDSGKQDVNSIRFNIGNIEALDYHDSTFDVVVGIGILEYLTTDKVVLKEVNRVLKSGGFFITNVTNKYAYTNIFDSIYRTLKSRTGVRRLINHLKPIISGSNTAVIAMNFAPRKHNPSEFQSHLKSFGFHIKEDRYMGFSVLPSPLDTLALKLTSHIDEKLEKLDKTFLRVFGACYIVCAKSIVIERSQA